MNLSPEEENYYQQAFAKKFHGNSYDKKNIYIKKLFKINTFEDYLCKINNNNRYDNQTNYIIKKAVAEARQNNPFAMDQHRLYYAQGDNNAKLMYPDERQPQFFITGESIAEIINVNQLALSNDIKIEPIQLDSNPCVEIFSTKFSSEKIQTDYDLVQDEGKKKIEAFNQNVLALIFSESNIDTPVFVAFPKPPIIVKDENYHSYLGLIEKRLNFIKCNYYM